MAKQLQYPENIFEVRESKMINYIIASVFFLMLVGWLLTTGGEWKQYFVILLFLFIVAFGSLLKGIRKKLLIRVDHTGIYYKKFLVSNWNSFDNVSLEHEFYQTSASHSLQERYFILVTFFNKVNRKMEFRLEMTSTQDKSEEQILSAIKRFASLHSSVTK